jgi:HSP20 family protein
MSMERWDPDDVGMIRNWVGRFFNDPSLVFPQRWHGHMARWVADAPAFDVYETESEVVIKAEAPGYRPGDVDIMIYPDRATIAGKSGEETEEKGANYLRRERRAGNFTRTIALPTEVNTGGARASFRHGVLELRIPKADDGRRAGRKVQISPGDTEH